MGNAGTVNLTCRWCNCFLLRFISSACLFSFLFVCLLLSFLLSFFLFFSVFLLLFFFLLFLCFYFFFFLSFFVLSSSFPLSFFFFFFFARGWGGVTPFLFFFLAGEKGDSRQQYLSRLRRPSQTGAKETGARRNLKWPFVLCDSFVLQQICSYH